MSKVLCAAAPSVAPLQGTAHSSAWDRRSPRRSGGEATRADPPRRCPDGERWGWGEGGKDGKMMSEQPLDVAFAEIFRHALFFPNMLR